VSTNYSIFSKKFEEEMNSFLKRKKEKQPKKQGLIYLGVLFFLLQKNFREK
jgi:hypothetical protein